MHIIWHGQSYFQIITTRAKGEQICIAIDPFDDSLGLKVPSFQSDILLITHNHYDHSNKKAIRGQPFIIEGPGEYEVKKIFIQGISAFHDDFQGRKRGLNTIYTIEAGGMRLCHLGDLGQKELTPDQLDEIGDVDILMVPVGGVYTIDGRQASKIVSQIEPRIVIPMHYQISKLKIKLEKVDEFLRTMGRKSVTAQPKILVKKKDLPEERKIVVLKP